MASEQRIGGRLDGAGVAVRFMDIAKDLGANGVPTRSGSPVGFFRGVGVNDAPFRAPTRTLCASAPAARDRARWTSDEK
jgi:hypothetical protein